MIVAPEVLDVLEEHDRRLTGLQDPNDLEEQVAALDVVEAVLSTEAQLLRDSGDAERLTRESSGQNVKGRDVRRVDGPDVAAFADTEIRLVGLPGELVDLDRVDAGPAGSAEADPDPADSGEQVDESELALAAVHREVVERRPGEDVRARVRLGEHVAEQWLDLQAGWTRNTCQDRHPVSLSVYRPQPAGVSPKLRGGRVT